MVRKHYERKGGIRIWHFIRSYCYAVTNVIATVIALYH